jgi:hypothetical protein
MRLVVKNISPVRESNWRASNEMPRGPRGEKRPADVIGAAVKVMRIATGEEEEQLKPQSGRIRSGRAGGVTRSNKLSSERRREIAKKAATARWKSKPSSR